MQIKDYYTREDVEAIINTKLLEVAETFGGFADRELDTSGRTAHAAYLRGRCAGFRLVQDHCERMAAIYGGDK